MGNDKYVMRAATRATSRVKMINLSMFLSLSSTETRLSHPESPTNARRTGKMSRN